MGGATTTLTAPTIPELKSKVEKWYEVAVASALEDERLPWDEENVRKTDNGYEFTVSAHS